MRLLLDTHVFLRFFLSPKKIRRSVLETIERPECVAFLSSASVWEMAIKAALGRLDVPGDLAQYVRHRMGEAAIAELPVTVDHALAIRALPALHGDPFDRMLVAQAQVEGLTLVTSDRRVTRYHVRTLPA